MNWTQISRENLNCYALSLFRVFILLASSDSDMHMLVRQKVQTKIRLYLVTRPLNVIETEGCLLQQRPEDREDNNKIWSRKEVFITTSSLSVLLHIKVLAVMYSLLFTKII